MKKLVATIMGVSFLVALAGSITFASEFGTAPEAEAMVKKAVQLIKTEGKEKAFAEFNNPKGKFVDRDLYVTVYDFTGKCLAHGANSKMVGKDLISLRDPDGKPFVKERSEIAQKNGKGWIDFKWQNPVSKNIEPQSMYFERFADMVVCCGFYKK